jgi:dipeptidyl aminopeptidase/acylaminoacyl peptidase
MTLTKELSSQMKRKAALFFILFVSTRSTISPAQQISAQQEKKPFTVSDDIGMTLFWPVGSRPQEVHFSPDSKYFAVYTERGCLDRNRVEDSLRFYLSQDVENFLEHPDVSQPPAPVWIVNRSNDQGPIINDWRWLPDSSGVAFLEGGGFVGDNRLVLADLRTKMVEPLTPASNKVKSFDIRDRRHYVYSIADPEPLQKLHSEHQAAAMVGTGLSAQELFFPNDPITVWIMSSLSSPARLWAVVGGKRFEVANDGTLFLSAGDFALSPDGRSLVTQQVVSEVPTSWETLYPPPFASYPYRIHAGRQDLQSGQSSVHQYVQIYLPTGSVQPLTNAPYGWSAGWGTTGVPSWSNDGRAILLPGTFLKTNDAKPSSPCIAVVDLPSKASTCVETLKGRTASGFEEGYHFVADARFIDGDRHRVIVKFSTHPDHRFGNVEYRSRADSTWQLVKESSGAPEVGHNDLEIKVEEGLDRPPMLVATNKQVSRLIWDPNPQLKDIDLGLAGLYKWKDKGGQEWRGGLYKPSTYTAGQRYPLVIQTHGFLESHFAPSGFYATANTARELTSDGIVVLQVDDANCASSTPSEGPCAVSGYEAAARQLVSEGLVDPERIGIIGFSRTCYYVMETLTTGSIRIRAASITDGQMVSYLQYLLTVGYFDSTIPHQFDAVIGAQPFGDGLQEWLKQSPGFNLDKVKAPLLVVGEGSSGTLIFMWETYAGLRYLHKPVDLVMLNTTEHVLTTPAVRLASQGGSVDWFRFWLQGYEDPDPAKAGQYIRWHELSKMRSQNESNPNTTPPTQ